MPNKKKLYDALVKEGYNNFENEDAFNAYVESPENRKTLYNALVDEGFDNFEDESAFHSFLGYGESDEPRTTSGGVGTQEEADAIFEANAERYRQGLPIQRVTTQSVLDAQNKVPDSEIQRLQGIMGKAQRQIDEASFFDRFFDEETRTAVATRNKAEEALEMYDEANREKETWFDRNVVGALKGFADKVGDLSTWDFGASGVASAVALKDAVAKMEAGEKLSSAEQNLLDAYGLASAVQAAYQDKVGMAYNVGGSLPESMAFGASLALNPLGGAGKKIGEAAAKAAVKKYGTSLASKLAKGAARVGGDVLEMGVATAVPGAGRVAEDYYNRLNGQATFDIDENGIIRYGGQVDQEEADNAIWKAIGSQFIENYSEAMGNYFAPMGQMLSNLTSKGLKAAHLGKFAEVLSDVSSSQFSKGLQRFKQATKFDGLVGEYLEEVAGNVMNAATVGDMNFNSPDDPRSVFNPETNIETFLSCALLSGTMYAVEAPVSMYNKNVAKKNLNKADTEAKRLWGDRWDDMRSQMDEADPQLLAQLLTGVQNATDLSDEQKQAAKDYGMRLMQYQGYNARRMQNVAESTSEANAINNAYDEGSDLQTPADKHQAKLAVDRAEAALGEDAAFVQTVMNGAKTPVATINSMAEQGYSDEQIQKAKDYYSAMNRMNGMTDALLDEVDSQIESANVEVDMNTNKELNQVIKVVLRDGRQGYVVNGTVTANEEGVVDVNHSDSEIMVRFENGDTEMMNPNKDLQSVAWIDSPAKLKENNNTVLRQSLIDKGIQEIDWNPATPNPKVGDSFEMGGVPVTIVSHDGNGGMFVVPTEEYQSAVGSEQKMQQLVAKAQQSQPIPASEYKNWASAQLDAQEDAQAMADAEVVAEEVVAETQPTEEVAAQTGAAPVEEAKLEKPVIPTKEDGSVDFVAYGKEGSFKILGEKYGEKMPHKVEVTAKAWADKVKKAQKKVDEAQRKLDDAPIGEDAKQKTDVEKAKAELESVKVVADFWAEMDADIKAAQAQREAILNPVAEVDSSAEPQSVDEFVAQQLASGNIVLNKEDFKRETGFGTEEVTALNGGAQKLLTDKGMTIQEAGERLMEMDRENGTNFFDQSDPNAGRDALIDLLGSVKTRKELNSYIKDKREYQAERETEALRSEVEDFIRDNFHMTPEDYATLLEVEMQNNPYEGVDLKAIDAIFAEKEFGSETLNEQENESEGNVDGNSGESELLHEEQAGEPSGNNPSPTDEQAEGIGSGTPAESETSQASQSSEVRNPQNADVFAAAEKIDAEEKRRRPLRNRANEWAKALGVKVHFIERVEDVKSANVREALKNGNKVAGWYSQETGEVFFLMPNLDNVDEIDNTYVHEVVAHKGMFDMLGKERYDELCDKVWEMMPKSEQKRFINYPGVNGNTRIAADEYIAHLSESLNLSPEQQGIWDKIVQFFRELFDQKLNGILSKSNITNDDISNLIRASYANLKANSVSEVEGSRAVEEAQVVLDSIKQARKEVDTNPTEAQKEAGNYKKGHIKIDGFNITIENPKGGVRSGTDKNGKKWSITMNNDYGYIRGTEAVDGDHIDVFLSSFPTQGSVFVVDQSNEDGSFDESKVMYGFSSLEEARSAYLSNYEKGWESRIMAITEVSKEEFKKWVDSSHRKTKAFSEYKNIKTAPSIEETNVSRMADIEARILEIEGRRNEISDELSETPDYDALKVAELRSEEWELDQEQSELEAEYSGLRSMNDESNAILENEGSDLRFSAKKKESRSIKNSQDLTTYSATQSNDRTKVRINKESAKVKLENLSRIYKDIKNTRGFLGDLNEALGISEKNKQSRYFEIEFPNGNITLRTSNHNAKGQNFKSGEDVISVVVKSSRTKNSFERGEGVNLSEYVYFKEDIKKSEGDVLSQIAESISEMIDTGVFVDKSGLARVNPSTRFRVVYHGSGANFDKFDHSFMGTGEGNQSFGWGTYVTDVKGIGENYGTIALRGKDMFEYVGDQSVNRWVIADAKQMMDRAGGYDEMIKLYGNATLAPGTATEQAVNFLKSTKKEDWEGQRHLYEVEIPDDNGSNYIAWDKMLPKEQAERIKEAIRNSSFFKDYEKEYKRLAEERLDAWTKTNGGRAYKLLGNIVWNEKDLSQILSEAGFVGFKYPTNYMSGGNKEGTNNYVIFNENDLQIVEHTRFRVINDKNGKKTLVGLHNISESKLKKAIKQGGLANPSMAVIDLDKQSHVDYGDITLIAPSSLIDKKTGKNIGTYTADAWTPIYPNIEKRMSDKGAKAYSESLESVPSELRNKVRLYFNAYLEDGNTSGALNYWFLHDTGKNPPSLTSQSNDYTNEELDAIEAISNVGYYSGLNEEERQKVLDLFIKKQGDKDAFDAKIAERIETMKNNLQRPDLKAFMKNKVEQKLQEIQEYGYDYEQVSNFYSNAQRAINNRGKIDEFRTFRNAQDIVNNEGLQGEFNEWLADKEEQFGVEEYLFVGYNNNGDKKYLPNTLENASKLMKKEGRAGATGLHGFNHFVATLAPNAGTLAQINKKKGNLSTQEEYDAFREKWGDVYHKLAKQLQPDATGYADYGYYRLEEMPTVKNPKEYVKKEYGIELSDEFMKKYNEFVSAIKNDFPARYFETKFERPVYLNEFAAAVVPQGTSKDVVDALTEAGLPVEEYESGNNEARMAAVDKVSSEMEGQTMFRIVDNEKQKQIDKEYVDAVHEGDFGKAVGLFREYVLSKAEEYGVVPIDYAVGYRGHSHSSIAKKVKEENPDAISEAAYQMSKRVPKGSILVPMPSRSGKATYTIKLAEAIAKATDSEVKDVLKGEERMSVYEAKKKGLKIDSRDLGLYVTEKLPKDKNVIIVDNVIDRGITALAAVEAVDGGSVLAYAFTKGSKDRVVPLKLSDPITYDDNLRIIPLSERFNANTDDLRFRVLRDPAVDYISQAEDIVEVPRDMEFFTMNNVANKLYQNSGRFMRDLYKYGTLGRVLKGEYAEIDQIKAKKEYDHAKPILDEYLNQLVWMKHHATEAAQEVINDVISDVEYAMQYYKDLALGKDVWRTNVSPRFRISEYGKQVKAEVDRVTSKYKGKEVMFFDAEMTDEEVAAVAPGYTAADLKPYFDKGALGGYSSRLDKISIFADNNPVYDVEDTIFHENLHVFFADNKNIVEAFAGNALSRFPKNVKSLQEKGYSDKEIPEELLVRLTAKAMSYGIFDDVRYNLTESEFEKLKEFLKHFGYDYREEVKSRSLEEGRRGTPTLLGGEEVFEARRVRQDSGRQKEERRARKEELGRLFDQVADMGLDGVLGNRYYGKLLMDIYQEMPLDVRRYVSTSAVNKYGGDFVPAMSDYLNVKATAEIWGKVVGFVRDVLRKVGFDLDLNQADVKYMLWRSQKPMKKYSALDVAEDIDARRKFGVDEGERFRTVSAAPFDPSDKRNEIVKKYDAFLKKGKFNFIEAFQDRMYSVKVFMDMIVDATGKKVRDFEDAYEAENQLGSINKPAEEKYLKNFYKPIVDTLNALSSKYGRDAMERYIYCKSGLERNEVLRQRDADEAFNAAKEELDDKLAKGQLTQPQYDALLQQAEDQRQQTLSEDVDYSGIRGMLFNIKAQAINKEYEEGRIDKSTRDTRLANLEANRKNVVQNWKQFAENEVAAIESRASSVELKDLWKKINAATNETLRMDYESGMIDKATYDAEKNMMKYYVPLRNWADTTAEEMYEYRSELVRPVSSNQKRAKGRESQADNPIATIALMAQNAIVRGNRNKVKQKFYAFVANRETGLASVRDVWYVKDPTTDTWEAKYADTTNANDAAEFAQILDDFETDMQLLESQGLAYKGKLPLGMKFRASRQQKQAHVVPVMINGKEYAVYVNGNPRPSQAMNGETNSEAANASAWYDKIKRIYGAGLTSWNPDFIIPNMIRDGIHASTMTFLDAGPWAAIKFAANGPRAFGQVFAMVSGVKKHWINPKYQAYFEEFVANGGETGYTAIHTLEDYKKEYDKLMNEVKGLKGNFMKKGIQGIAKFLEATNRIFEDVNRFNAYVSARESGESIMRSISSAKNITVNFNRKGALSANNTAFGTIANAMSKWILFFNPAVQGIAQLVTKTKVNPKRAAAMASSILASGFFMPMLNEMLVAANGGDDEDDYWNQSDFKRRNNWLLFTGDGYASVPLPPVLRELYGIGDIIYGSITGHITPQRAVMDMARQVQSAVGFVNLIPEVSQEPDMVTWAKGFAPDIAAPVLDVISNTNFMGRPIAKWTDFNEYEPEYARVYKGVSPQWVELSKLLNKVGGQEGRRSDVWGNFINPAMMEHLVTSYGGGIGKTINNLAGMLVDKAMDNTENLDPYRKSPIVPRFYIPNDEKTVVPAINRKYYDYDYMYNVAKKALKTYQDGVRSKEHPEWKKYIDEMQQNGELEFIRFFEHESKRLTKMQNLIKGNPTNKKELEEKMIDLKADIATKCYEMLK